jgi:ferritin-like metal-binding protein YciE
VALDSELLMVAWKFGREIMQMQALEDLFIQEITELYGAERQIVKALPKMASAADQKALRTAFETHYKQTQRQIDRLDKIFAALKREPESADCQPIAEILRQGDALISTKQAEPAVLDAALITAAQKVEHYEIAMYGSARSHARMLGYTKIADVLEDTLSEEEQTDALLTQLATKTVNIEAAKAPYASARVAPRGADGVDGGIGVGSLISGLAIGAAIALLYSPRSGAETRGDLKRKMDEWRGSAENLVERGRERVGSTM